MYTHSDICKLYCILWAQYCTWHWSTSASSTSAKIVINIHFIVFFLPVPSPPMGKAQVKKSFLWKAFNHTLIHIVERKKAMWKMYTTLLGKFDFRKIRQATYSNVLVQITAVLCILLLMLWKVTEKALGELHSSIWQSTACISRAADNKCQPHFLSRPASCRPETIHLFQTSFCSSTRREYLTSFLNTHLILVVGCYRDGKVWGWAVNNPTIDSCQK